MLVDITLSNYRCFPATHPATFTIGTGVTAFVGENNAGKSAILRALHDLRPLIPANVLAMGSGMTGPSRVMLGSGVRGREDEIFTSRSTGPLTLTIKPRVAPGAPLPPVSGVEIRILRPAGTGYRCTLLTNPPLDPDAPWRIDGNGHLYLENQRGVDHGPATQLVNALAMLADTLYIPSTRHVHPGPGELFDLKNGEIFAGMWDNYRNGESVPEKEKAHQVEQAIADLFGVNSVQISKTSGQPGMQFRLGNDLQRRSDELGNGLAQAIVSIFTAALKDDGQAFILIDEPEIGLHPKLQMRFLQSLQRFARVGVVFTTHNLGLAMNAAERVYTVSRTEQGSNRSWSTVMPFEETMDLAAFLGSLSHASFGDAESRSVLLVEGPSDVRMAQVLLKQCGVAGSVVVIHAGGSTTYGHPETARLQLTGLVRVCSRIWCLADGEGDQEGVPISSRTELKAVCDQLKIPCLVTRKRALENYLTDEACRAAFHDKARALKPGERHDAAAVKWDKSDAWKGFEAMSDGDWAGTDVWEFFQKLKAAVSVRA